VTSEFRNLCFVGHPTAGKTTLVDALAFALGATDRKGSVADKTSVCDTEPEEHERQHTFVSSTVSVQKDGVHWNLIDTPGYPEFVADAVSAMFATETTIGVVSCASGVTYNFHQKMARAAELGRGRAVIVTHVDSENADFDQILTNLRARVGRVCVPVFLPDRSGHGFSAVEAVSGDWRKRLCDRVMDACEDEEVVMTYLDNGELGPEELMKYSRTAIAAGAVVPVMICNPVSGLGVDEIIRYLQDHLPTPETTPLFRSGDQVLTPDPTGPLVGVVYSVKSDPHVGKVCSARIVSGTLQASDVVGEGRGEKLGGLFHLVGGKSRNNADHVVAGDLCAFSKVESLKWGKTFTVHGKEVPPVDVPELPAPMVAFAATPKSRNDEQKIGTALAKLEAEDPGFHIHHDAMTHELVLHGMSDLHLQIIEARLKRRYGVEINTSMPRIAFRETVTKPSEGHHRHKKQTGGRGQFGECFLRVRPGAEGSGVVFLDKVVGGAIPRNFIPAIEKGLRELAEKGILASSRVVDVEVEVYDGKFHAVDSDEASFKRAGALAFKDGFLKAGPVLLEPIMEAEIHVPSKDAGTIFSDITSHRRGHVIDQSSEADGSVTVIKTHVPLATMQTYHRDLKSQTAGEGSYAMVLHHYAQVPAGEQQKIISQYSRRDEED